MSAACVQTLVNKSHARWLYLEGYSSMLGHWKSRSLSFYLHTHTPSSPARWAEKRKHYTTTATIPGSLRSRHELYGHSTNGHERQRLSFLPSPASEALKSQCENRHLFWVFKIFWGVQTFLQVLSDRANAAIN